MHATSHKGDRWRAFEMKHFTIILTIFFLSSCSTNNTDKKDTTETELSLSNKQSKTDQVNDTLPEMAIWADDYIIDYLENNSERLTEVDGYPISYIKETTTRQGRKYAMVKIGHSFEHRYVTDQWIFIDSLSKDIYEYDLPNDSLIPWSKFSHLNSDKNEIPPNGTYQFDVAFAEWQGKSMGVKLTIIIKGDSAKVVYEGHGALTAEIGEVIDEGIIMKHKSGQWIIGTEPKDKELEEVGGCTGGPAIIDFKEEKYWMC
ncbi:MAG TPA: hypothetical protein PKH16_14915 [Aequorivita sp.]|nr:hypothetical protein [Aequorivita sp.]